MKREVDVRRERCYEPGRHGRVNQGAADSLRTRWIVRTMERMVVSFMINNYRVIDLNHNHWAMGVKPGGAPRWTGPGAARTN